MENKTLRQSEKFAKRLRMLNENMDVIIAIGKLTMQQEKVRFDDEMETLQSRVRY